MASQKSSEKTPALVTHVGAERRESWTVLVSTREMRCPCTNMASPAIVWAPARPTAHAVHACSDNQNQDERAR